MNVRTNPVNTGVLECVGERPAECVAVVFPVSVKGCKWRMKHYFAIRLPVGWVRVAGRKGRLLTY